MTNSKLDMEKLDREFEFIVDRAGSDEENAFSETIRKVGVSYNHCKKNYGEPCNNSSNQSCPGRGEGVTHCHDEGVSYCDKVNNQGCHGSGRFTVKPKRP